MTPVLKAIKHSPKLELQVYITGIHLMPDFGLTAKEVHKLFPAAKIIQSVFKTDDRLGMAEFTGNFLPKVIEAFKKDRPDFVLTLGDRPEMLCVALACLYSGIPVGHIHGGDRTATVDEIARHAITKLSHIHFPATQEAAKRIEKIGEEKWRIHIVGAPALDVILKEQLPKRKDLFEKLGLNYKKPAILLTQHPVSEEYENAGKQMAEVIAAVKSFKLPVVVIYPHADAGGRKIITEINKERKNPNFHIFPSLPYKQFLALEREAAAWVGNSSAAMIESASFKTPVVNVGNRQSGRQHADNVLNTGYNRNEIRAAIKKSLYDKNYLNRLKKVKNPWGDGRAAERIARVLEKVKFDQKFLWKQITF